LLAVVAAHIVIPMSRPEQIKDNSAQIAGWGFKDEVQLIALLSLPGSENSLLPRQISAFNLMSG
jgi:hypothetical protein